MIFNHLFFIAQYHNFYLQHHEVVCILLLYSVCGRPTAIFYSAFKEQSGSLIRDTPRRERKIKVLFQVGHDVGAIGFSSQSAAVSAWRIKPGKSFLSSNL
jgi:hypothetical protein